MTQPPLLAREFPTRHTCHTRFLPANLSGTGDEANREFEAKAKSPFSAANKPLQRVPKRNLQLLNRGTFPCALWHRGVAKPVDREISRDTHVKNAPVERQRIAGAMRRAGSGAPVDVAVAHYRAPSLADELGGKCSADLLGDLAERLPAVRPDAVPIACDLSVLRRLDRLHTIGGSAGAILGFATGSILGGIYAYPLGFVFGAILFPGPVLAICGPFAWRHLLVSLTPLGRKGILIAYGVHLRTQERHLYWNSLTWQEFERAVADLFSRLNFRVQHVGGAGDKGIDIVASRDDVRLLIQCKKHNKPVGPAVVRELIGSIALHSAEGRAVLVSSSGFTSAAMSAAAESKLLTLDVDDLVQIRKRGTVSGYL